MDFTISVYGAHKLVPEEGRTVEKIMRAAAGLGFDGIDLGYYWGENTKAQEMKDAKTLAEDLQLKLTNYICGNNFGNAIAEDRLAAEIDKVKTALDEAAEFGCKNLRVFGGGYDLEWEKYASAIADALGACVEHAQKNNVIMAIEDHGALCKNSSEQLFYITTVNSPFLRATCDIGNYWTHGGELPEQGTAAIADMAVMVHVKDYVIINNKYTSVPSGDGIIDLKQCFRILRDADYQGTLSLEYECSIGEGIHGISTSLSNMRRLYVGC